MRMDTVIMGGGLSALACGISLAKRGKRVTIVASGQSTMLFNGGSMELLGCIDGKPVEKPLEAIATLPQNHPYSKIGADRIAAISERVKLLFSDSGIEMTGSANANHWRITPMGVAKPAWLTLNDHLRIDDLNNLPAKHLALMCVRGFFDVPNAMLAQGLRELGFEVDMIEFTTDDITSLRRSPSEMRATSLAKRLVSNHALQRVADQLNSLAGEADMVLMPSVFGQNDSSDFQTLQNMTRKPLRLVATLPPSVAGMRMMTQLRHYFRMLGGTYLMGDTAVSGTFEGDKLTSVTTAKLGDMPLKADNFVLATGSFVSRGLRADYERIYEPVLGVDVVADNDRERWTSFGVLQPQAYFGYGVATDEQLRCLKNGKPIQNLRAIGSVLSGHDPVKMGDGTGVSLITAIAAADHIRENK
ncbi:MAG: anaerobic glycerol-3-phosphate dehydrogenase subunit B [Muribaculaceae bacterium]|nr:anaerobic glycerol-3-phosphate dehydrogenase subunit B [Muribaculaceae bacterium]